MPKKKIFLTAVIWFIGMFFLSAAIIMACQMAYRIFGIDPSTLTKFGGDVSTRMADPFWKTVLHLIIIAPVAEEIIFRTGLTLKRRAVALWAGLLPVTIAAYFYKCYDNWMVMAATIIVGVVLYWLVMRFTTDGQWTQWRSRYLKPAMWVSATGFGLTHLLAFSTVTWLLLPYCLAMCLRPAMVGAVCCYARVNLGFWWGVLFHIINNVPGVLVFIALHAQ